MATDIRQFCNVCHRKLMEGECPEPCKGDGRKRYIVEHPAGSEFYCRADSIEHAIKTVAMDRYWDKSIMDECTAIEV